MIRLPILDEHDLQPFPAVESALREPNGLLAAGGDLRAERLLLAYSHGIFPWYSRGEPILWWSPDPRLVFDTGHVHVPRRLQRWLKQCSWTIHADSAFVEVMRACAAPRPGQGGTWISSAMIRAYAQLHELGHAHSIEVREGDELVGGIYGVAIGHMFFGESMFSRRDHASKVALLALCRGLAISGFPLLDAQVSSAHLRTLGATEIPRRDFIAKIAGLVDDPGHVGRWQQPYSTLDPRNLVE